MSNAGTCLQYGQLGANKGGMPCTMCPHVGCQHSYLQMSVTPCPECEDGSLVLDPLRCICCTCFLSSYVRCGGKRWGEVAVQVDHRVQARRGFTARGKGINDLTQTSHSCLVPSLIEIQKKVSLDCSSR